MDTLGLCRAGGVLGQWVGHSRSGCKRGCTGTLLSLPSMGGICSGVAVACRYLLWVQSLSAASLMLRLGDDEAGLVLALYTAVP